jgi:hypothetical protein
MPPLVHTLPADTPVGTAPRLTVLAINDSIRAVRATDAAEHRQALMQLPGIGPARVANLVANGPYVSDVDISARVSGVTPAMVAVWLAGVGGMQVHLNGTTTWT